MALSGTTTFTLTRDQVITDALIDIGGLAIGGTPTTAQLAHASSRLNTIIKAWQAEHIYIVDVQLGSLSTVASQSTLVVPSDMRRMLQAWLSINGTDTILTKLSQYEYDSIPQKSAEGQPTSYYIMPDEAQGSVTMYFYPVPDDVYTIGIRYEGILADMTSGVDNFDLPQDALDFIVKTLAYELAVPYGLSSDRVQIAMMRAKQAKIAYLSHANQDFIPTDIKQPRGVMIT